MFCVLRTMGKTMSLTTLYSVILHIGHTLYTLTEILSNVFSYFTQIFFHSKKTTEQVNVAIKKLDKIPRHIVVVLGTETPSYRDLANIVVWCVTAGIPYISFYEHSGLLKRTKNELYNAVVEASLNTSSWNRTLTGNVLPSATSEKNGVSAPSVYINVLSLADGRGAIADLTRECATNNVNSAKITVDFLDKKLQKRLNHAPDPEMALCCGSMCGTYGVLPWQVRSTEFINIKTHHNISVDSFLNSLHAYGYCEQRFGK